MDNPISTVTSAAKSAISIKSAVGLFFGFLVVAAIMDALGLTQWLLQPVTAAKAWNAKRTA